MGYEVRRPPVSGKGERPTTQTPAPVLVHPEIGQPITRDRVIATLRAHEPELRARGVVHAALFGSLARGEAGLASDIDLMIDLLPDAPIGLFEYVAITQFLEDLFPTRVDVAERRGLKPLVKPYAERDAIYAF